MARRNTPSEVGDPLDERADTALSWPWEPVPLKPPPARKPRRAAAKPPRNAAASKSPPPATDGLKAEAGREPAAVRPLSRALPAGEGTIEMPLTSCDAAPPASIRPGTPEGAAGNPGSKPPGPTTRMWEWLVTRVWELLAGLSVITLGGIVTYYEKLSAIYDDFRYPEPPQLEILNVDVGTVRDYMPVQQRMSCAPGGCPLADKKHVTVQYRIDKKSGPSIENCRRVFLHDGGHIAKWRYDLTGSLPPDIGLVTYGPERLRRVEVASFVISSSSEEREIKLRLDCGASLLDPSKIAFSTNSVAFKLRPVPLDPLPAPLSPPQPTPLPTPPLPTQRPSGFSNQGGGTQPSQPAIPAPRPAPPPSPNAPLQLQPQRPIVQPAAPPSREASAPTSPVRAMLPPAGPPVASSGSEARGGPALPPQRPPLPPAWLDGLNTARDEQRPPAASPCPNGYTPVVPAGCPRFPPPYPYGYQPVAPPRADQR